MVYKFKIQIYKVFFTLPSIKLVSVIFSVANLIPAAMVTKVPLAYIKVVAVKSYGFQSVSKYLI